MQFMYDHSEEVARFVAALVPHCARGFGKCATIGILDDDGRLIAGLVYHHWDPDSEIIEVSGAAIDPRWLTRTVLRKMFEYPFLNMMPRSQMIVMRVRADNERLLRQLAVYGFNFIAVPRMFGRDADGVIATLTDDAWLENKFSRRFYHLVKQAA